MMLQKKCLQLLAIVPAILYINSCAPSRAVLDSPNVTPKGTISGRFEMGPSITTATLGSAVSNYDIAKDWIDNSINSDTNVIDIPDSTYVRKASELLLAYATDPFAPLATEFTFAVGLPAKIEVNYAKLGGGNRFGARYQILDDESKMAVGAYYASQDYELPSMVGKAQSLLGYTFERKDITIPIVWGKEGGDPKKVHYEWGLGLQFQKSTFTYGFSDNSKLMLATWVIDGVAKDKGTANDVFEAVPQGEASAWSLGGMVNGRVGFKWVNVALGLGIYYNDYGSFTLLDKSTYEPTGVAILPRIALEIKSPY